MQCQQRNGISLHKDIPKYVLFIHSTIKQSLTTKSFLFFGTGDSKMDKTVMVKIQSQTLWTETQSLCDKLNDRGQYRMLCAFSFYSQIISVYSTSSSNYQHMQPTYLLIFTVIIFLLHWNSSIHRNIASNAPSTYTAQTRSPVTSLKINPMGIFTPYLNLYGHVLPSWSNFFHWFPWHLTLPVVSLRFLANPSQPPSWLSVTLLIS